MGIALLLAKDFKVLFQYPYILEGYEVMWMINEQRPHFKTIANFRKDNPKAFKGVFRYFVAILKDWKLIDGKTIAIDSFKIRTQNSLKNNFNQRQQIIEHQFGTIKRQWHFDYTLTKGKEKVLEEVYLIFIGYNLRRLMSIFD